MKFLRFIVVALALCATSCLLSCGGSEKKDENGVKQTAENNDDGKAVFDVTDYDVAYIADGKFCFYRLSDSSSVVYEGETGEIMNFSFKPKTLLLYYTVCENQKVILKSIDFGKVNPQPVTVVDFNLSCEDCVYETYGGYGELLVSEDGSAIGMQHNFSWDGYGFSNVKIYYPESGRFENDGDWEIFWDGNSSVDYEDYEIVKDNDSDLRSYKIYYVKNDPRTCLSDKIDFVSLKPFETNPEDFNTYAYSSDGKYLLYGAILSWGDYPHGPYCVASLDGRYQRVLDDTDVTITSSICWSDKGFLLYVGSEPRPVSDPEYNEYNSTKPCVKLLKQGSTAEPEVIIHGTDKFILMDSKR